MIDGDFEDAVNFVLAREGGFVDSPNDSGGVTNMGISLRFLQLISSDRLRKYGIFGDPTIDDIKLLTVEKVKEIYRGEFWDAANFGALGYWKLRRYVFDMAVNHGINQAIKILQRATWGAAEMYGYVQDDGILGAKTIQCVNNLCDPRLCGMIIAAICSERAGFYRLLAQIRPKDKENLHGWLERCYTF